MTSLGSPTDHIKRHQATESVCKNLCDNLVKQGWSQHDLFLPVQLMLALADECMHLHEADILKSARVGRADTRLLLPKIRGDAIAWLHAGQSVACDTYLAMMEQVRVVINQTLYLGLEEYESHFAFYASGATYSKHLDRFFDDDARTISVVVYLNENWAVEHGGALRLHPQDLPLHDISPIACRLVVFLSADMLHEVLPATRDRMSLAGWFRRRVKQ